MLDSARQLDNDPRWRSGDRLPIISTLMFAGPRAHELSLLNWGVLDFGSRVINVEKSKTQAGHRAGAKRRMTAAHSLTS